ncbi:MAG: hypothetical protein QM286_13055 [Acidobacteriota bacterium]|nr:hypothetical protein [Acidobacteriota bacterium]
MTLQIAEQGADSDRTSEVREQDLQPDRHPPTDYELRAFFSAVSIDYRVPPSVMDALRCFEQERLAGTLVKTVVDALVESDTNQGVVVFAARKMACLYWVLRQAGLRVPNTENVFTDRFALLKDARTWQDRPIFLRDDTWVSGTVLKRRARRLSSYLQVLDPKRMPMIDPAAALNADPNNPGAADWHKKSQIAVARTFAASGVPYFTDFPVSQEVVLTRKQYMALLLALDPSLADVTNAAIATDDNYAYTLSVKALLNPASASAGGSSKSWAARLERCAHIAKLRVFVRRLNGSYGVRFMPIVVLAAQSVTRLLGLAEKFGINVPGANDLLAKSPEGLADWAGTAELPAEQQPEPDAKQQPEPEAEAQLEVAVEVLKQLFGYVEYLATRELFAALEPMINQKLKESGVTQINVVIDDDLARFLLGRELASECKEHERLLRDSGLDEKSPAEQQEAMATQLTGEGPIAVGDDLVTLVDNVLTRCLPDDPGRRVPFCELKETCKLDSWSLALALDVLNDLGRAVPDQIVGKKDGIAVVRRSYRLGEASKLLDQLQEMPTSGKLARLARTIRWVDGSWQPVPWTRADTNDQ